MKHRASICIILISLTVAWSAVRADAPPDAKAVARQALAIRAVAQEALARLDALEEPDATDREALVAALAGAMTEEVKAYRMPEEGRAPAGTWVATWRAEDFMAHMESAVARAAEQSPLPVSMDQALQRADPEWQRRRDAAARVFSESLLDEVYAPARARAVERLRGELEREQGHPAFDELDARLVELDAARESAPTPLPDTVFEGLDEWLRAWSVADRPVFQELDAFVQDASVAIRNRVRGQYGQQYRLIAESVEEGDFPKEHLTASAMADALEARLASWQAQPDAQPPIYPVFTAIRQLTADAAAHWESARFESFLKESDAWKPSHEELSEAILADPSGHADPEDSAERLAGQVAADVQGDVAKIYAEQEAEAERDAVATYIAEALDDGGVLRPVLMRQALAAVRERLPAIRATLADLQLTRHFPALAEQRRLSEAIVEPLYVEGTRTVQNVEAAIRALASDPKFAVEQVEPGHLLQETRDLVVVRFNALAEPAVEALARQLEVLRALETDWMDQLRADVERGERVERLLRTWTREWERRWKEVSKEVAEEWRAMFDRTSDDLNKTVRQLYSAMEQALAEEAATTTGEQPEEPEAPLESSDEMTEIEDPLQTPGEDGEPMVEADGVGTGEDVDVGVLDALRSYRGVADGVLAFTDLPDGRCRLMFGAPDGSGAMSVEFDPEDIETSARLIAEALGGPLRDVLNGNVARAGSRSGFLFFSRSRGEELRMLFRVDSPSIRHQMSIRVRRLLDEEISNWSQETGQPAPTLIWQEETGETP